MLIGLGWWRGDDKTKFPRFMVIAEEAERQIDMSAGGKVTTNHLEASTHEVTTRIDALEEKVGAMDSKLDAMPAKLLEAVAGAQAPK